VEKVQGYSLSEIVATYRQRAVLPSYILVVDWFQQACCSLATIHATGRIHRSIGLERIFVGAEDDVRIDEGTTSDFARGWADGGTAAESRCAAPEQLSGRMPDQRTDLYSLGAAFYELLTLHQPGAAPDPPSSINRTVPKGFDALLLRMLAAASEDRYGSVDEVLADLAELRRSPGAMGTPALVAAASQVVQPAGVPRAAMIVAGAVLGAIGGAIAGWFLNSFLPVTIIVGAVVGGVVGCFSNSNA
jgi:serine/threonine protein kinase